MSELTQVDRIVQLFVQYWDRDHKQESLEALRLRGGLNPRQPAVAHALMAEAFIDVMEVDLDVRSTEHQQIWGEAFDQVWAKFGPQPKALSSDAGDFSHLDALSLRLSNEQLRLGASKSDAERAARKVTVAGIEREIEGERALLGLAPTEDLTDLDEDALLSELGISVGAAASTNDPLAKPTIDCYVEVSGDASEQEDDGIQGFHCVEVTLTRGIELKTLSAADESEIAKAVLDSFHDKNAIGVLDDFDISVHLPDGKEIWEEGDEVSTGLVEQSRHQGMVDWTDLPYFPDSLRRQFWEEVVPYFGLDESFNYDANLSVMKDYLADYERSVAQVPQIDGPTKLIEVRLSALTRVEYTEIVEVPVNITDDQLNELVNKRYETVGGDEFVSDPEYWERGTCYTADSDVPGERGTLRVILDKNGPGMDVIELGDADQNKVTSNKKSTPESGPSGP